MMKNGRLVLRRLSGEERPLTLWEEVLWRVFARVPK
jgi:hypothetical protein